MLTDRPTVHQNYPRLSASRSASFALLSEIFPPVNGGSGRWFYEVYRRLPLTDFELIVGHSHGCEQFDAALDLPLHRLDYRLRDTGIFSIQGLIDYRRLLQQVIAIRRKHPFAMLHCARCLPEGWIGWMCQRIYGIPYLCYAHGEEVNLPSAAGQSGVMSSRQHRWMARQVFRSARTVIANSENTLRIVRDQWHVPDGRLHVVRPGVDVERFRPAPPSAEIRQLLGWQNRTVVLTVGRLQQRKGHDMLIRALPAVRKRIPDILYAIIGQGEEAERLTQLARDIGVSDCVQFLSDVNDDRLVACYQQCDLFALPNRAVGSDIEGFGMVLLEAQSCGKPVLAGDSGGTAETMDPGRTGLIVDCTAPAPLATAMIELLLDDVRRRQMGEAAFKWATDRFSWPACAKAADAVFRHSLL